MKNKLTDRRLVLTCLQVVVFAWTVPALADDPWLSGWCSHRGATFGQADFNGDGRADLWCHDPIDGSSAGQTWVALSTGSSFTDGSVWISGWCSHRGATFGQADFNGDGRADLWCHDPIDGSSEGKTWVALSTGSGFTDGRVWLRGWCSHRGATFGQADFDGDGKADLWCHDPINGNSAGQTWVALSTGSGFTDGNVWLEGWCSHRGATFGQADFNGDGRDDLWCHDPIDGNSAGQTWVALSTGSGFTDGSVWLEGWCSHLGAKFGQADFDGDGRADLWCHDPIDGRSEGKTWVALSTGSSFSDRGVWLRGWCSHFGATFGRADFDDDGRADLWCHDPINGSSQGQTWVALSTGSSFANQGVWRAGWCSHRGATFGQADFNGDGRADLWCHDPIDGASAGQTWVTLSEF